MSLFKLNNILLSSTIILGGLIISNFAFSKEELIAINSNDEKRWNDKLGNLFLKTKDNDELAIKIDKRGDGLALVKNPEKSNFQEKEKALGALKIWCFKKDKGKEVKYENEFCKYNKSVGWLFGNS